MRIPFWVPSLWVGSALLVSPDRPWLVLAGYHAICLIGALRRQAWTAGRMDRNAEVWIALALALPCLACLIPPVPGFPSGAVQGLLSHWPGGLRGHAIYAVLVNAPLEEGYWRGALLDDKRGWTDFQHGLAFGLHHGVASAILFPWVWTVPAFLVPAFAGALWTWIARRKGGIAVPLALHILSDLSIALLAARQLKAAL